MKRIWIPQAIAGVMLLWALNPANPYGYYILLRWVCCAAFTYLALKAHSQGKEGWVWVLGVMAVIYNPIIRIHLTREIWSVLNIATAVVAILSVFALKREGTSNASDKTANIRRLKELTTTFIQEALAEIRSECPNSSEYAENRFRTAEYFLLEAPDYVDGAWQMLLMGNARASLAISRWTLEAALNLWWVVSDRDKANQRLTDLVGEALCEDAKLREGLAEMWPDRAHALRESAKRAREMRDELGPLQRTNLRQKMEDAKPADKPDWPNLYVHYRACCAAVHPGLKVWERFNTVNQAVVSVKTSGDTVLTSDMAIWMAAASALLLVSFACSLANGGNAEKLKAWWNTEVAPLLDD